MSKNILVSIICPAYNHEKYVSRALEGFVMQQTEFNFEIIIHDDASTDRTGQIIRTFEKEYPDLIFPIYQTVNQYSTGKHIWIDIMFPKVRGKYIALCEGDDYWTDPYKLQKQVDFLEQNEDYILSCHDASVIDSNGSVISESKLPESCKRDFTCEELITGAFVLTLSICFRNVIKVMPAEFSKVSNGDTFLLSMLGVHGKSKYQPEIMPAVYRSHPGGFWSSKSEDDRRKEQIKTYYYIFRYHKRTGSKKSVLRTLFERYLNLKLDSINILVTKKYYYKAFISFLTAEMNCIASGYFRFAYKSFRKSIKALAK